ncbi:ParB/RepB/Spo0J family partition protein [Paraburkholderia terricola]|uniref:ParB/RepB/Spo0J family partition protein n=1 Tax=Paraburkholderia terricola TaxID=169427 RepID=UPI0009F48393|nr:ParB/RepB/Spo0J family partition protein [Paraburkholderia terricola]AXE92888.1 transcriptional regulator [Paraburkholderia terricola]ORC49942.1 transcriptional regulator [Burkholderia sp. A27]
MANARSLLEAEPIVTGNTKAAVKAAGGGSSDLWTVPPDQIHYDPRDNVRPLDQDRVRHLAELMKANGYDRKKPLGCFVRKVDGQDRIFVYEGQHRYHAALLAIKEGGFAKDKEIDRLPVVIDEAKSVNRVNLIYAGITNNDGEKLTPLQLAEKVVELQEFGESNAAICKRLNVTDQTIRDVLLLANAPLTLQELVRNKVVSSTLAIEEIRAHGGEKALERLQSAAAQAKAGGKAKVTKKALAKPTAHKVTEAHAKQLLQALQSVLHDPVFGKLSPGTIAAVHTALTPHADLLDAVPTGQTVHPIHVPNEHGAFADCENIRAPITGRYGTHPAQIHLAQPDVGVWIYSISAQIGHCAKTGLPSIRHFDATFPTRGQAIRAAVSEFTALLERPNVKGAKELATVRKWLDKLWTMPDPDWTEEIAKESAK